MDLTNVQEVIKFAKGYVLETFKDENPQDIGLEEVAFDESAKAWEITIGFSRAWDNPMDQTFDLVRNSRRIFKIVRIRKDGEIESIKHRDFLSSTS